MALELNFPYEMMVTQVTFVKTYGKTINHHVFRINLIDEHGQTGQADYIAGDADLTGPKEQQGFVKGFRAKFIVHKFSQNGTPELKPVGSVEYRDALAPKPPVEDMPSKPAAPRPSPSAAGTSRSFALSYAKDVTVGMLAAGMFPSGENEYHSIGIVEKHLFDLATRMERWLLNEPDPVAQTEEEKIVADQPLF